MWSARPAGERVDASGAPRLGRGAHRALRVAWTLADLAGLDRPGPDEITEALAYRDRRPEQAGSLGDAGQL